MICRVVLMKLNAKADQSVIAEMQRFVERIRSEVMETQAYYLAPNKAGDADGHDWVLHSAFDNEDDMNRYRESALHLEFVSYCDPYTENFLIAFYNLPAS